MYKAGGANLPVMFRRVSAFLTHDIFHLGWVHQETIATVSQGDLFIHLHEKQRQDIQKHASITREG